MKRFRIFLFVKHGIAQLRDWMKRRGFNQHDTADFFGWHDSVISQYLSGARTPDLTNAVKIREATGVPVEAWLLSEDDKSPAVTGKRKIHAA